MYGKATGDDLDLDDQIIDKDFARDAVKTWMATGGNVRQMHSTSLAPAGKGVELTELDDGFYVRSRIVEPTAMKLALEDVYCAYSVGISRPRIIRDDTAKGGRIVGGVMSELSLVDRPANPTCKASVLKMAKDDVLEETGGVEEIRTAMTELAGPEAEKSLEVVPAVEVEPVVEEPAAEAVEKPAVQESQESQESQSKGRSLDTMPLLAKALHDGTCPAYTHEHAVTTNPMLNKGAALALGPQVRQLFWQMLSDTVAEDAGTGANAWTISCVARAYCDLHGAISSLIADQVWDALADNDGSVILAAAHAEIRKTAGVADDTDEQAIKEAGSRSFYTNAAKDQTVGALRAMHDSLATMFPDVCTHVAAEPAEAEAEAAVEEKTLVPDVTAEAETEFVRAAAIPDLVKAAMLGHLDQATSKFEADIAERDAKIATLTETVEKLAAEPDPNEAPRRGRVTVVPEPETARSAPEGPETDIAYLEHVAKASPNPQLRLAAKAELTKLAAG